MIVALIFKDQKIQFMDIRAELMVNDTIEHIYQKYSHMIKSFDQRTSFIDFKDDRVNAKISDVYGWTQLLTISKVNEVYHKWKRVKVADKETIISDVTFLPCYDIKNPYKGFHGEVKYHYKLKHPSKLNSDDWIRIHRGKDENGNDIEFDHPIVEDFNPSKIECGYSIISKSRFGNVGDIEILLTNSVTMNEVLN